MKFCEPNHTACKIKLVQREIMDLSTKSSRQLFIVCSVLLKSFQVSNRAILLFCILATLTGSFLCSDWQAIGHDACSVSGTHLADNITLKNTTTGLVSVNLDELSLPVPSINMSLVFANHCIAMSTEDHSCYWNPTSRVTGKVCIECHPACRSEQRSINFIQFCVGINIILFVSQLFITSVYSVASDCAPKAYQVGVYLYTSDRLCTCNYICVSVCPSWNFADLLSGN